jgi:hypothetical protein
MSAAGKFIPGGTARKTSRVPVQGPIRGPEHPGGEPSGKRKRRILGPGLTKPVPKNRRLPILIMSSIVCCLLVSVAWYEMGVLPARRALAYEMQVEAANQKQLNDAIAAQKAQQALLAAQQAHVQVKVDSSPAGTVTIGNTTKATPAEFTDVKPGKITVVVTAVGYDDYREDLTVAADMPVDLGTVQLVRKRGNLDLSTPQKDVFYDLTGPDGYDHQGQLPDNLQSLSAGTYQLAVRQHDWQLPPITIVIAGHDTVQKEVKFPYGSATLTTVPPGATVRNGNTVLGQTPLSLAQLRPGPMNLSFDLPPYAVERVSLTIPEFGNVSREVALQPTRDLIAACGMPMVWIQDGYWAGKYEVTQRVFEAVAGYNPSSFRGPNRPVEMVSWEEAAAFCDKLNQLEQKAGKLPKGYHYTLPTESQWETFSADANIEMAAMSRGVTLSSTQDVGFSEPNKYGLYDTLGNVWEWCLDTVDDKGAHSLRGGSWLSSAENFPSADTRSAGVPKYADRFTGFRVVLVPQ